MEITIKILIGIFVMQPLKRDSGVGLYGMILKTISLSIKKDIVTKFKVRVIYKL